MTAHQLYLDLGHGWPTFADTTATAHARGTGFEESHDEGCNVGEKQEPEECRAGLKLVASLRHVVRPIGQAVGADVTLMSPVRRVRVSHFAVVDLPGYRSCERRASRLEQHQQ